MKPGYRAQVCPRCGARFPVLARVGYPLYCCYAHAEQALRVVWPPARRSA